MTAARRTMLCAMLTVSLLLTACGGSSEPQRAQKLSDVLSFADPDGVSYSSLSDDGSMRRTAGVPQSYAVSLSAEDGYAAAEKKYGSLGKADRKWGSRENTDAALFAAFFLTYTQKMEAEHGTGEDTGTKKTDAGTWFMYSYPADADGQKFTVFVTWENGYFVTAECAYAADGSGVPDTVPYRVPDTVSFADGGSCSLPGLSGLTGSVSGQE